MTKHYRKREKRQKSLATTYNPIGALMEINHLPPPAVAPIRSPSMVDDGDVGQNSPDYHGRQKKQRASKEEPSEDRTPRLEGSTLLIDIRV